jgi:hypothetical protein
MIIFYGDTFKLNVTDLNIKYIEESSFFYDAFYKNYTPPFNMPLDEETSLKLGLIDVDNVSSYTIKHEGKLFIDTVFYDAYLLIESENEYIEGSFYYGKENLPLLETPLSELPFPTIDNYLNIRLLASDYVDKSWPEVSCNFPMVFDDDFSATTNYKEFEGIVNNFDGSTFVTNNLDAEGNVVNKNILVPFPYIMEILKVGFNSAGKQITGAFVNKKENEHLLLDTKQHLETFSSTTSEAFQFSHITDQFFEGSTLISEYEKNIAISAIGNYKINTSLNLPGDIILHSFKILQDDVIIFETKTKTIQEETVINKTEAAGAYSIKIVMQLVNSSPDVSSYNNFYFEKSEGKLNVFKDVFSLAEFMPDMTFGGFLQKLKNWLNLKVELYANYVVIDYVEDLFSLIDFKDETAFEVPFPARQFNQIKRYKITTENPDNEIYVGKDGLSSTIDDIREEDIKTIDTGVSLYEVEERNGIFAALRNEDADFGIILYNGKDAANYAISVASVDGFTFSLQEIYTYYWKKWLYFRLNSETYTDKFTAHSLEEFNILVGRYKYNKKHIIKKITRQRVSEEEYLLEIESETL